MKEGGVGEERIFHVCIPFFDVWRFTNTSVSTVIIFNSHISPVS